MSASYKIEEVVVKFVGEVAVALFVVANAADPADDVDAAMPVLRADQDSKSHLDIIKSLRGEANVDSATVTGVGVLKIDQPGKVISFNMRHSELRKQSVEPAVVVSLLKKFFHDFNVSQTEELLAA